MRSNKRQALAIVTMMFVAQIIVLSIALKPQVAATGSLPVILASLSAAGCILVATLGVTPAKSPEKFRGNYIVALALAEMVFFVGQFLGGAQEQVWRYTATALGLIVVFVVPKLAIAPR